MAFWQVPQWAGVPERYCISKKPADDEPHMDDNPPVDNEVKSESTAGDLSYSTRDGLYIRAQAGSRHISLALQPAATRVLINTAIRRAIGDALFVDPYLSPAKAEEQNGETVEEAAKDLGFEELLECSRHDNYFRGHVCRHVSFHYCPLAPTNIH